MDDLHGRFRRLDRVETPNLWNEAVIRAAELELAPRRAFKPGMGLIAVALLLAALGGTIAVGAWLNRMQPVPEAVTYDNGMIAATRGCGQIIGIDPTSLATREIAAADCQEVLWTESPAWSSDGSRLAYVSGGDGTVGVWVHEAATGESRQIDTCGAELCGSIDISPDGSLVTYIASELDDMTPDLVVLGVDSGESQRIELESVARQPRFSPDGTHIALPLFGGRSGIYLVDIRDFEDGNVGTPMQLSGIIDASGVQWSPDGEWIAYGQSGGLGVADDQEPFNGQIGHAGTGIVVARADGSETRVLATGGTATGPIFPTWSADSASVAYVTTPTETIAKDSWMLELWTVAIGGGEPTRIYASGWGKDDIAPPHWSPDGEWIAFGVNVPDDASRTGTFLVRPDGSDLRRVSNEMLDPAWQPIPEEP